jgi:hypothetical protein
MVALVESEVLLDTDPPRFVHPILRDAVEMSLDRHEREVLHRAAAALLYADRAPAGRVAAHLRGLTAAGDAWACGRLREAAAAMLASGAPQEAAELLSRAWAEPPPVEEQLAVLRELARVEAMAGRATARDRLDEALARTGDHRERARIALQVAQAHSDLFRWVDAVDVVERAVAELGDIDAELTGRLQAQLVVAGLHDARRAALVVSTLRHLAGHPPSHLSVEAEAVADGMAALLAGRPAADITPPLRDLLSAASAPVADWNTRAALLWCLVTAEDFDAVEGSIGPMLDELAGTGSARGLIAVYSSLGFLKLRLGALPEADAAARVAQRVMDQGDFTPGLPFAVAVRAEVAVEAGQLAEHEACWSGSPPTSVLPASAPCSSPQRGVDCIWPQGGMPRRLLPSGPARRCSPPRCGGSTSVTSATCTPAPAPQPLCSGSATATRPATSPMPSWPTCAGSARRGHSAWHCELPGWRTAVGRGWICWPSPWRH